MAEPAITDIVLGLLGLAYAAAWLFTPRLLLLLTWVVLFAYPQRLFYGQLPFNAGLDDLYMLAIAIRMLGVRRAGHLAPLAFPAVLIIASMVLMETLADMAGILSYPSLTTEAVKTFLKGLIWIAFTVALALDIRTPKDVQRHILAYSGALAVGFLVAVACFYFPTQVGQYWEILKKGHEYMLGTALKRAFGAFSSPAATGAMSCAAVPIGLALFLHKPRFRLAAVVGTTLVLSALLAVFLAKSRSGMTGICCSLMLMSVFSRQRKSIIVLEIIGLAVVLAFIAGSQVFTVAEDRFATQVLSRDLNTRVGIWARTITNPSIYILFFGEGAYAFQRRLNCTPHNGYLDMLFVWGLGGLALFGVLISRLVKWSRVTLRLASDTASRASAWGILWGGIGIAFYSLTGDPWFVTFYRLSMSLFLVIVCSRYLDLRAASTNALSGAASLPYTSSRGPWPNNV